MTSDFWKQLGLASKPEFDEQGTVGCVRKQHLNFDAGKTQLVLFYCLHNYGLINWSYWCLVWKTIAMSGMVLLNDTLTEGYILLLIMGWLLFLNSQFKFLDTRASGCVLWIRLCSSVYLFFLLHFKISEMAYQSFHIFFARSYRAKT